MKAKIYVDDEKVTPEGGPKLCKEIEDPMELTNYSKLFNIPWKIIT